MTAREIGIMLRLKMTAEEEDGDLICWCDENCSGGDEAVWVSPRSK